MSFTWYEGGHRIGSDLREIRPVAGSPRVTPREGAPKRREAAARAYERASEEPRRGERAVLAHQIMSQPVETLTPDTPLTDAWALVRRRRFRHVPVVNEEGQVTGILSDRDLLEESGRIAEEAANLARAPQSRQTVGDLATTRVLTAHPDTQIRDIARVMFEERIGAMPVVEESGKLTGQS